MWISFISVVASSCAWTATRASYLLSLNSLIAKSPKTTVQLISMNGSVHSNTILRPAIAYESTVPSIQLPSPFHNSTHTHLSHHSAHPGPARSSSLWFRQDSQPSAQSSIKTAASIDKHVKVPPSLSHPTPTLALAHGSRDTAKSPPTQTCPDPIAARYRVSVPFRKKLVWSGHGLSGRELKVENGQGA
jgi:hypothetical protein